MPKAIIITKNGGPEVLELQDVKISVPGPDEIKVGETNHEKTTDSNLILLKQGKGLQIKAEKDSEFLFIAGKPIGEPIARGGPFVMNTKAEIIEAINDYQNGTFAKY